VSEPTLDESIRQQVFQELQSAERAAWTARGTVQVNEEDIYSTADLVRDIFFSEERRRRRREISLGFGIGERDLHAIELEGVLQGWPLEAP